VDERSGWVNEMVIFVLPVQPAGRRTVALGLVQAEFEAVVVHPTGSVEDGRATRVKTVATLTRETVSVPAVGFGVESSSRATVIVIVVSRHVEWCHGRMTRGRMSTERQREREGG
jgi:hypothetical protein